MSTPPATYSNNNVVAPGQVAVGAGPSFGCGVMGGMCLLPGPAPPTGGHVCPGCGCSVHNLCHQRLRSSDGPGPNGFMCGGAKCALAMTSEEQDQQLRVRDGIEESPSSSLVRSTPPSGPASDDQSSSGSGPCGAGVNCVAKPGSTAALTVRCPHGQLRHFVCSGVPCSPGCGTGQPEPGENCGRFGCSKKSSFAAVLCSLLSSFQIQIIQIILQ